MGRRTWRQCAGLAAACAVLPFAAAVDAASAQADPYSVLVFTKNATVGAAEGVAALQASAPAGATFDVSADASKFTDAGLAPYKAVVFLNTTGDVLDACPGGRVREVLPRRGRLPRHRLGDRDRAELGVLHQHPRHARERRGHDRAAGDDQGRRPRPLRGQGPAGVLHADRPLVQLHEQRARLLARDRDRRREDLRRRHDGRHRAARRAPDRLVQGLPGRPFVLHRPGQHRRRVRRRRTSASTSAAPSSGRPARPTRSTATAARPCSRIMRRPRSRPRRT